ncbi:hypothetical protein KNE206_15390 [Kitasatospora sp. NE20-6]
MAVSAATAATADRLKRPLPKRAGVCVEEVLGAMRSVPFMVGRLRGAKEAGWVRC